MTGRPRFSIGITTFRRLSMLRECVESVLRQSCGDFEILIGNDAQDDSITPERLGIDDPRIRIINHPVNLGELANLNALLQASRGTYFTWQADDDFYAPNYLEDVAAALEAEPSAGAVLVGYAVLRSRTIPAGLLETRASPRPVRVYDGAGLLRDYWRGRVRTMALVGVFQADMLRRIGGLHGLSDSSIAVMSEYYLLLQVATECRRIVYAPSPLVYYRAHEASWSTSSRQADLVERAGVNLIRDGAALLRARLERDPEAHVAALMRLVLSSASRVLAREAGGFPMGHGMRYLRTCLRAGRANPARRSSRWRAIGVVGRYCFGILPSAIVIAIAPASLRRLMIKLRDRGTGVAVAASGG